MTASQKAMLLAMEYPDPEKGGRGKTVEIFNGFDPAQLSKARKIVKWAPELITGVMGGAVKLMKMATRIRDRAIRRAGELLKQIEPAHGANQNIGVDDHPKVETRKEVAAQAGMSPHQAKQAIRVANVPAAEFEKQVESPNPPTVTKLAERRLADEYDAAQERGEVATRGGERSGKEHSTPAPSAADIGLSRKDIHEARQIRDAEKVDPITPPLTRGRGHGAGLARSADP